MSTAIAHDRRPMTLRVWPAVVIAAIQWFAWFVVPRIAQDATLISVGGGALGGAAILVWWLFFSRAPWLERLGAVAAMIAAVAVTKQLVDRSISNGMMGMMLPIFSIPALSLALVAAVVVARRWSAAARQALIAVAIVAACGAFMLLRTGGVSGSGDSDLHWRWTPTPEQRLLAAGAQGPQSAVRDPQSAVPGPQSAVPGPQSAVRDPQSAVGGPQSAVRGPQSAVRDPQSASRGPESAALPGTAPTAPATGVTPGVADAKPASRGVPPAATPSAATTVDVSRGEDEGDAAVASWAGFRGAARDGVVRGIRIDADWAARAPSPLWRKPIGPGWSSFAVRGDRIYTQEQRGEEELVSAYRLSDGEPVWQHKDAVRFWESNGGAGPRGTPTVRGNRVYALGATGRLNALDAATGRVVWSRDAAADTKKNVPTWGIASSPLVLDRTVVVAVSGQLAAYDADTGSSRWLGPTGHGGGYSSPHLVTIEGVAQIVLLSGGGATGVDPRDGRELWSHAWTDGVGITQPALADNGDILITGGDTMGGTGVRRLHVTRKADAWSAEERWTSNGLKPYFNDFVVHKGYAFGFDGSIMSCIDLADGTRKWKGGRYGHGQLVLLPDQDLLLVLSEEGELALVKALPDGYSEVARVPGIEGKTWNHPVLIGTTLLVRNGEEMAAFRLEPQR